MQTLVSLAIVGTGQQAVERITSDTAVDELISQVPVEALERTLLLTAGALSIYQHAGYLPAEQGQKITPAGHETLPVCSAKAAHLLSLLFQENNRQLLPEALAQMKRQQLRFSYDLLPLVLDWGTRKKELRSQLLPLLGERGFWLSQYNPQWSWVNETRLTLSIEQQTNLPEDAETIWQEGTLLQRQAILQSLRDSQPALARQWLADVWKQEKAEARLAFLEILRTHLSSDDLEFLENAQKDRSSNVRSLVNTLLGLIPSSPLVQRMQKRAEALLTYDGTTLQIKSKPEIDADWERDGLQTKAKKKLESDDLLAILSVITPNHWQERFTATPEQLVACLDGTGYTTTVQQAWLDAAFQHKTLAWVRPLIMRSFQLTPPIEQKNHLSDMQDECQLLSLLPQAEAEKLVLEIVRQDIRWVKLLSALPQPWSHAFSEFFTQLVCEKINTSDTDNLAYYYYSEIVDALMYAVPPSYLDQLQFTITTLQKTMTELTQSYNYYTLQHIETLLKIVALRKQIIEEIV